MADSNSLVLLPPRPAAQAPQDTQASRSPRAAGASGDETFKNKLEKAKKLKAHVSVKRQIALAPQKPVPVKTPAPAKPPADAAAKSPASPDHTRKPEKPVQSSDDQDGDAEEKAQAKQHDAQTLPVPEAVEHLAEKKPVKASKPVATKAANPVLVAPKVSAVQAATNTPGSSAQEKVTRGKSVTKGVGIDDSDADADGSDSKAPVRAADAPEFGTGKLVNPAKGDAKDSSNDPSAGDDSAAQDTIAAASAAAIPVPGFVAATPLDVPSLKSGAHIESPVVDVSSAAAGLGSAPMGTAATSIAGKTAPVVTPQTRFVEDNQPRIISSIQGQLMPHGGTMQLRLDPPELGALSVTVHMRDGVMTASFETSNPEATKMLSHSLGQLKAGLEAVGVNVDKIHVEQGSQHDAPGDSNSDGRQGPQEQQRQAQQDQQRREMVQRMWRKLAVGDPLDLVA